MNSKTPSVFRSWRSPAMVAALTLAFSAFPAKADILLGPLNPGFENGSANWNAGGPGGSAGSENFSDPGTNGPSAPGDNCVLMTADGSVSPPNGNDLRCDYFSIGPASAGSNSISIDFDYNILNPIYSGDQIRVGCRFEDSNGNFLGEHNFHLGAPNNDAGGTGWHHFHGVAADPTLAAVTMDIRISMNIFGDDIWGSGPVLFDNFAVKVTPSIGVNNNGDFEEASANWNSGGPNDSGGYNSFYNANTNGPSAPGTNCALMSADGSVTPSGGNDMRVNNFFLGAATRGANGVSVDFDYYILNPIYYGDEIRVGLRFEDSGGGFLGEHNFHLGTPNNDVGGDGWHHFHGVAVDPTRTAVTADLRLSMNIFGDDIWGSGPILFDNFVVKATPVIGVNNNGDFENGNANWNSGVNTVPGGYETFDYGPGTNGPSAPGTNCVMMSADGSLAPPNGNDIRVNEFALPNNTQPVTISFDYNILNPITTPNQIRVGLRFFDSNNNYNGEQDIYIGTPNGDLGAHGWQHISETASVPANSVNADIRVSMNIFGDDIWSNGPVLFDNFVVITGTNYTPIANNVLMGTVTNIPVTRAASYGVIEPDGILSCPFVSYLGQPAHGIVTANGSSITYTATNGYVGADSFTFIVSDGLGGLVTNTATVLVNSNAGLNKFTQTGSGGANNAVFTFSGAPSCDYVLQSAASLTPPVIWVPVVTNSADGGGSVTFNVQQTIPAGFFRTSLLP